MTAKVMANRQFEGEIASILDKQLGAVVGELRDEAKDAVGTPFPPQSTPGSPPHKRSGGLQDAIFSEKSGNLNWVFGVQQVDNDNGRERDDLGLWMELGTGDHRESFPDGTTSVAAIPHDTATTGHGSGVAPRPFLIPTLINKGPGVAQKHFSGKGGMIVRD